MIRYIGPYGAIAALCALLNVVILVMGDAAGLPFPASVTISFGTCVIFGFALHSRYTFRNPPVFASFLRYAAAMSFNYPLSLLAIWLLVDALQLPMIIAAPASTVLLTIYNYLSTRWALLRRRPQA